MGSLTGKIDRYGPFVYATFMATSQHVEALKAQNRPIPPPVSLLTLVDTGSATCVLDMTIVNSLQLIVTGKAKVHTTTTGADYPERDQYDVSVLLNEANVDIRQFNVGAIGTDLASEGIVAIIGWDVLRECILTCDGPARRCHLDFRPGPVAST